MVESLSGLRHAEDLDESVELIRLAEERARYALSLLPAAEL